MRFKDKIVLITGSAGGIGFKTALDFGNEGAIVAVTDIDFEMAKKLSNQIISNGGVAEPFQLDVTDLDQTKNVFETLNEKHGVCDIVFCNAGIREITPMLDLQFEEWKKVIDINVNGVFLSAQTFAKNCVKHSKKGNIVITASTLGIVAANSRCAYTTSKHATVGLTKQLAMDLAEYKIRVNAICPGSVEGDRMKRVVDAKALLTKTNPKKTLMNESHI